MRIFLIKTGKLPKNSLKLLLATLAIIFASDFLHGQMAGVPGDAPRCGTDVLRKQNQNKEIQKREEEINHLLYTQAINKNHPAARVAGLTYVIPVVVHIVHNGGPENIPDSRVQQAIQDLNDAFANNGAYNQSKGINTDVQFCLAIQDEQGNLTTGITRTVSPLTDIDMETQDLDLKNLIRWDPEKYLNIWVINEINSSSSGPGVAGYAYFPSSHGRAEDGIVVEARWMGSSSDNSKVLIHETGHYLGCYHTFEEGCSNSNCLLDGDKVCDTPPDASTAYVACNGSANTCTTDADDVSTNNPFRPVANGGQGDQNDMTNNYMDYNTLSCVNIFTQGQKDRMIPSISLVRASLLASKGCQSPCTSPISLSFTPSATKIYAGQTVTFTGPSTAGATYNWAFGDGTSASGVANPSKTYASTGKYTVTCHATNADPNCSQDMSWEITVLCPLKASFTSSSTTIPVNTSLTFTNTSAGGSATYKWFVDGTFAGTSSDLTHTFTSTGAHFVQLVACSSVCCDTSAVTVIQTGNCKISHAGDVWCFGYNAGVRFSGGTPSAIPPTAMSQSEGVASMSDNQGNLLFYSNGQDVWDATNNIMPNGSWLDGSGISAQSSIIVPAPGSTNQYYIFTVHDWQESSSDLRYSIVDMSLNGGKGDIIASSKNTLIQSNIAERVTAVFHKNCKDIWIISHEKNNNRFVAYLLTASGLNTIPVISNIGSNTAGGNRYGYLRISHDSKKLCSTLGGTLSLATVELFDFDNQTGTINNPVTLESNGSCPYAYCSEFSPDNRILYVSAYNGAYIYQYDLYAGTPANITASRLNIATGSSTTKPSLQMGPDSKIYVSTYSALGAINNPNALGTLSDYKDNAVPLYPGTSGALGLPNFIPGLFGNDIAITGPANVCLNAVVTYEATSATCLGDVTWKYQGTGKVILVNGSKITIDVGGVTGQQTLKAETATECGIASAQLLLNVSNSNAPVIHLASDTAICGPISLLLDAGPGYTSYNWSDGSTGQTITVTAPGKYCVTVTNASGCFGSACINVEQLPAVSYKDLIPDHLLCGGKKTTLNAGGGYDAYLWSTGAVTASIDVTSPGKYWINLTTKNGCKISDTIQVNSTAGTTLELGPDKYTCNGSVVLLDAGPGFKSYLWQSGYDGRRFTAYLPGKYWVTVEDTCGVSSDTIRVIEDCPLALQIISFEGRFKSGSIVLWYKLADIPAGTHAYIQKSYDGETFTALPGSDAYFAGYIEVATKTITDFSSEKATVYYRLVLERNDHSISYSAIITVQETDSFGWEVHPNPSESAFRIDFGTGQENDRRLYLYTPEGKLIEARTCAGNLRSVSIGEELPPGLYILSILEDNNRISRPLVKIK